MKRAEKGAQALDQDEIEDAEQNCGQETKCNDEFFAVRGIQSRHGCDPGNQPGRVEPMYQKKQPDRDEVVFVLGREPRTQFFRGDFILAVPKNRSGNLEGR